MVKKLLAAAVAAMVLTSGAWAAPDPDDTRMINKFGHVGVWNTHSAQTLGFSRLSINAQWNTSLDKNFIKNIFYWDNGKLTYDPNIEPGGEGYKKETFNVSLSYGVARFLDLGVMLPIYVDNIGERRNFVNGATFPYGDKGDDDFTKYGVGDLEISLKFQYPPYPHRKFFEMAYYGAISVPTGGDGFGFFPRNRYYQDREGENYFIHHNVLSDSLAGVYNFYTSNSAEIDMKMLWTWDFREMTDNFPVLFHVNYGVRWVTQWRNSHVFYLNTAIEVRPTSWLNIFTEFSASPRFGSIQQEETFRIFKAGDMVYDTTIGRERPVTEEENLLITSNNGGGWKRGMLDDPMRISPGVAFLTPIGITLSAGVDFSLARKEGFYYGEKATVNNDKSAVLIETGVEPKTSFNLSLGWNGLTVKSQKPVETPIKEPEPEICDTVRVVDTVYVDKLITDTLVQTVEVKQEVKTFTITASVAAGQGTITPAGVMTVNEGAFQTYTFTPAQGFSIEQITVNGVNQGALTQYSFASVKENQIITVSFKEDAKPVVVEVVQQAPVAVEIPREGLVLRGVNFQSGKAVLTPSSYEALDAVITSLKDWPEVKLEIQGHTDSQGKRDLNMRLSKDRANAVMKYFIDRGVPAERLRAVGFGPDVPVAGNDTPSGRELNRRVELKRFD